MGKKPLHKKYKPPKGFLGLPRHVFISPEYKSLSLKARCVLDELQNLWNGSNNNGRIVLSVEQAKDRINVAYNTARDAFNELQDAGFIERTFDADYTKGIAREWRLTFLPYQGKEPTDEWRKDA